jgi:RNA polymerase sigma factor (sigma-70 family)
MATAGLGKILDHLRKTVGPADGAALTDRELLACFAGARDETAFAQLVARHGSMVLGVCRRVLHHEQDAEDAFQATFLILARKAGSIGWADTAAPWLYEVARRTALEARSCIVRRRIRENQVQEMPEPALAAPEPDDWRPVLDEELSRLPEKYRVAVVLCELEGRPRSEAAQLLGVPEGTLSWRLAKARKMLAARLGRRGVTLSGALVPATVAMSPTLVSLTVKVALLVAAGLGETSVPVALMKGVLKSMFVAKLKLLAGLLVVAVALGAGGFAYQTGKPAAVRADTPAAKAPTELDVLRKEVELLKLKLALLDKKVAEQEAQLRTLKGQPRAAADPYILEFSRLYKEGRYAEAERAAQKALKINPSNRDAKAALETVRAAKGVRGAKPSRDAELAVQVEEALKAVREARDKESKRRAIEQLERAMKKLREQLQDVKDPRGANKQ